MQSLEEILKHNKINVFIPESLIDSVKDIEHELNKSGLTNLHIISLSENSNHQQFFNSQNTNIFKQHESDAEAIKEVMKGGIIVSSPEQKSFVNKFTIYSKNMSKAVFSQNQIMFYDFKLIYKQQLENSTLEVKIDHNLKLSLQTSFNE